MTKLHPKDQLLEDSGYRFNFDRRLYLNRDLKKAFSVEFVNDHSEEEIANGIREPATGNWRFLFDGDLSPANQKELADLLDNARQNR